METETILNAISQLEVRFDEKLESTKNELRSEMQTMKTDLRGEMVIIADDLVSRAFCVYEERLISLFDARNERLPELITTSNNHGKRLDQAETTLSIHGTAIKKISAKVFA